MADHHVRRETMTTNLTTTQKNTLLEQLQPVINGDDRKARLAQDIVEMVETGKNLDGKDLLKIAALMDTTIADLLGLPMRQKAVVLMS